MTYAPTSRFAIGLSALALLAASCAGGGSGGSANGGSGPGTGGNNSGTGGSLGTGGSSTGGTTGTGGIVSTGGTTGTGGSISTGGSSGVTGGVTGTGGTGTGGASGGSGGSAGKGGSTGTGGSSGTGGAAGAGATTFFTDDFESDTTGKQPAGFDNLINYNYKTTNPQTDGSGSAVVDSMHTHNGSKLAVHFSAQGGSLMTLLERPLPTGTNHLYVRAYFYLMSSIGNEPASTSDNHETLLALSANPANADSQIRFGQIKGAIGTNWVPSDDIAPIVADWNMGAVISGGTWHCIEVEFAGNAAYNSLYAYSDGTLVHSITSGADWAHNPEPANWMNGLFTDVVFGWQSFSSMKNDVWMDDLAMSSTGRIGCN
jgi:hypothetical protein